MKTEDEAALDRAGGQRRHAAGGSELSLDLVLEVADVALEVVGVVVDPAERLLAAIAGRVELVLPGLELLAGADQLAFLAAIESRAERTRSTVAAVSSRRSRTRPTISEF